MKSYIKFKTLSMVGMTLIMAQSCTKDFLEKNIRPSLITEEKVTADLLLTGVEYSAITYGIGSNAGNYAGMSVSDANAPFVDDHNDGIWNQTYTAHANNLASIIRITADKPELVNKKAIARILKAWVFAQATDTYGDIPYFDSNKAPEEAVLNPKYDSQKSIYEDLFKELKEAAAELDPDLASYGAADLIYGGNVEKWRKFANSLRLRLALRVRYVDQQMAQSNMSDLDDEDLVLNRSDDAVLYTSNDVTEHRNPNYNYLVNSSGFTRARIGKALLDAMVGPDPRNALDPRTKVIADTARAKWPPSLGLQYFGYRAMPLLGYVTVEEKYPYGYESTSDISDFWYVPVIEEPVLRSSEIYLALAEAALFGLRSGDANDYYRKGIEAGIKQVQDFYDLSKSQMNDAFISRIYPDWTSSDLEAFLDYKEIKPSEISAFMSNPVTTLSGTDEQKLEQIMNQKNIALYPQEYEGWAEWRRTGYPRVLVSPNEASTLHGVSRRREHYPGSESLVNSANNREAVGKLTGGTDNLLSKVWWDVNPDAPHVHPGTTEMRSTPWQ